MTKEKELIAWLEEQLARRATHVTGLPIQKTKEAVMALIAERDALKEALREADEGLNYLDLYGGE